MAQLAVTSLFPGLEAAPAIVVVGKEVVDQLHDGAVADILEASFEGGGPVEIDAGADVRGEVRNAVVELFQYALMKGQDFVRTADASNQLVDQMLSN